MSATIGPRPAKDAPDLPRASRRGEPTWEIAQLFPLQGEWSEADYLALQTNRLVELSDGCLDVHQEVSDPIPPVKSQPGTPPWEIAWLLPFQGEWTEDDYLALKTNRMIELSDGCLEFLPMPTLFHQRIVKLLLFLFDQFVVAHQLGEVSMAPLPVHLWPGKYREPDIVYFQAGRVRDPRKQLEGADLAVEVVSDGNENRKRDLETKFAEYAQARIREYWIVDPQEQKITVYTLDGQTYRVHGEFGSGTQATSVLLPGFSVAVDAVFAVS